MRAVLGDGYDTALICTYHGFCARLIRDDPQKLFLPKGGYKFPSRFLAEIGEKNYRTIGKKPTLSPVPTAPQQPAPAEKQVGKKVSHHVFGEGTILSVELLTEAIVAKRQVKFVCQDYGADKKLHPRREKPYTASPFQLFLKNGGYYLACAFEGHDDLAFVRVDRMTEVAALEERARPVTSIKGCENGLNLGKLQSRLPNLYYDEPQKIVFETRNCPQNIPDYVFDTFGKEADIEPLPSGEFRVSVTASPRAVRFWLLSFGRYVKVLSPQSLADKIKEDIEEMGKNYGE